MVQFCSVLGNEEQLRWLLPSMTGPSAGTHQGSSGFIRVHVSGTSVLGDNWVLTFPPCSLRVFASSCGGLCVPSVTAGPREGQNWSANAP